jgi:hypothetical protein
MTGFDLIASKCDYPAAQWLDTAMQRWYTGFGQQDYVVPISKPFTRDCRREKEDTMDSNLIAACGLDCSSCEIRLAATDPAAAQVVVDWFKSQGWLSEGEGMAQVIERKMYCTGCLGDRDTHWSADCWILACCVDQRGYSNCSECEEFPCSRLVDWSQQNDDYRAAVARLTRLRAGTSEPSIHP